MIAIDDLIPHMRRVQAAERDLHDLALLWQMIEATSSISCPEEAESILPMLGATRQRFSALQLRLVEQLGAETLAQLSDELAAAAQCTIDILVRNLYERTADVGFLATDPALRGFCGAPAAGRAALAPALLRRLAEYRAKYTVYDDLILLSPAGEVLARLDPSNPLARSEDGIAALAAQGGGWVERFGRTDLAAGGAQGAPALLYGHRIDDGAGRTVGVLVLRFRAADEMQRIFASVARSQHQVALLIDENDRVIASNDEAHVPLGARVATAAGGEIALTAFAGREYLSVTRATGGYQGYAGPRGWRAHAMVSLQTAFRAAPGHEDASADAGPAPEHAELARIRAEVDAINADLRRVVWNGRLVANTREGASGSSTREGASGSPTREGASGRDTRPGSQSRLKAVLHQINEAGLRTRNRVAAAIHELHRTSLGRDLRQARQLARLAADIMDRNLYERANDCRWWALSPVLERVLAEPADERGTAELDAVLAHVNGLYTVYSRLVAFDAEGRVRGVSNDRAEAGLAGGTVDPELVAALSALGDSQRYAVTPFRGSALSDGEPTYIYVAAVRSGAARRLVGGIAIVFAAARELRAMLGDVLGRRAGIAAFVDDQGCVVSCTDAALPPGSAWPFGADAVAEHQGARYAVASAPAGGYREFKNGDGYDNRVRAAVALHLGPVRPQPAALADQPLFALPTALRAQAREFALFTVGMGRYALPAAAVVEARPRGGLVRAPLGVAALAGLLEVPGQRGSCVIPVVCGRTVFGVERAQRPQDGVVLVVAAAPGRPHFGLLVDDVAGVLDVGPEHLQPPPEGLREHAPWLAGMMQLGCGEDGRALVQCLAPEAIGALVVPPAGAAPAAAADAAVAA